MTNKKLLSRLLGVALVTTTIASAHAVTMEAVFEGVVTSDYDTTGSVLGAVGTDILVGQKLTARFWYDSEDPVPLLPDDLYPVHTYPTRDVDWIKPFLDIGGRVIDLDSAFGGRFTEVRDLVYVFDEWSTTGADELTLEEWVYYFYDDGTTSEAIFTSLYAYFWETIDDLIIGDALPNYAIDWIDNDVEDQGAGVLSKSHFIDSVNGRTYIDNTFLTFDVTSFRLTPVSEPSVLALFGLGAAGFRKVRRLGAAESP